MAGALTPAAWYIQAQRFRRLFRERTLRLFEDVDVIVAPSFPAEGSQQATLDALENYCSRPDTAAFIVEPLVLEAGVRVLAHRIEAAGDHEIGAAAAKPVERERDGRRSRRAGVRHDQRET